MINYKIGEHVKASHDINDGAYGDSMGCLCAKDGDILVIREINEKYTLPILVSHLGRHDNNFGVLPSEIYK